MKNSHFELMQKKPNLKLLVKQQTALHKRLTRSVPWVVLWWSRRGNYAEMARGMMLPLQLKQVTRGKPLSHFHTITPDVHKVHPPLSDQHRGKLGRHRGSDLDDFKCPWSEKETLDQRLRGLQRQTLAPRNILCLVFFITKHQCNLVWLGKTVKMNVENKI